MREAGAEMVAFVRDEHLRLMFKTAERNRMHHPVAVALKRGAGRTFLLRVEPPAGFFSPRGIRRKRRRKWQRPQTGHARSLRFMTRRPFKNPAITLTLPMSFA